MTKKASNPPPSGIRPPPPPAPPPRAPSPLAVTGDEGLPAVSDGGVLECVTFRVDTMPRGMPRARAGRGHHHTPTWAVSLKSLIATYFKRAARGQWTLRAEGPISVHVEIAFTVPTSWAKWRRHLPWLPHTSTPDVDNLAKLVMDALNGVAWVDDGQVCTLVASKVYAEREGYQVTLTRHRAPPRTLAEMETPR